MFNSFAISVAAAYFISFNTTNRRVKGSVNVCTETGVLGKERPHNGAGVIRDPREEEQEIERQEKTGAVSSVYLVTALIYYRLL